MLTFSSSKNEIRTLKGTAKFSTKFVWHFGLILPWEAESFRHLVFTCRSSIDTHHISVILLTYSSDTLIVFTRHSHTPYTLYCTTLAYPSYSSDTLTHSAIFVIVLLQNSSYSHDILIHCHKLDDRIPPTLSFIFF